MVPLSLIGTHFVGLPTAGAFVKVPTLPAAPLVSAVLVVIKVVDDMFNPPFTSKTALLRGAAVPMPIVPVVVMIAASVAPLLITKWIALAVTVPRIRAAIYAEVAVVRGCRAKIIIYNDICARRSGVARILQNNLIITGSNPRDLHAHARVSNRGCPQIKRRSGSRRYLGECLYR